MYDQHASTPVGLAASAKPKLKVMFGYCCLYCVMWKLYYVLPPGYISRSISSWYNTIFNKSAAVTASQETARSAPTGPSGSATVSTAA